MPKTYKIKICTNCGKAEGKNWARHWKKQHPVEEIKELFPGEAPSHPFDDNWVYLIKNKKLKELFKNGQKQFPPQEPFIE